MKRSRVRECFEKPWFVFVFVDLVLSAPSDRAHQHALECHCLHIRFVKWGSIRMIVRDLVKIDSCCYRTATIAHRSSSKYICTTTSKHWHLGARNLKWSKPHKFDFEFSHKLNIGRYRIVSAPVSNWSGQVPTAPPIHTGPAFNFLLHPSGSNFLHWWKG